MSRKFMNILAAFTAFILLIFSSPAFAIDCSICSNQSNLNTSQAIECGSSCASGSNQTANQANKNLSSTLTQIIKIASLFVGAISVIMLIVGGFRYVASAGKQESITSAKNTIVYAVIGLIIVALAQIIVHFVLNKTSEAIK